MTMGFPMTIFGKARRRLADNVGEEPSAKIKMRNKTLGGDISLKVR